MTKIPPPHNLLILTAMRGESSELSERLGLKQQEHKILTHQLGADLLSNKINNIHLVNFGLHKTFNVDYIGTQRAALISYAACTGLEPNLILNLGTCGGVSARGADIGDTYLCEQAVYHDRRINLPAFKELGLGHYACHIPDSFHAFNLKKGILSTGSSLDTLPIDMEHMQTSGAVVKDMEGAAIAEVAELLSIPYVGIKTVTDLIDKHDQTTEEQFLRNFSIATENLSNTAYDLISSLLNCQQTIR